METAESNLPPQARFSTWLADELHPDALLKSVTSGVLTYILEIILVISFAALIFSRELADFLPLAVGALIAGDAVLCFVVALLSSYPGSVAIAQDAPSAILAVAAAAIAAGLPAGTGPAGTLSTVVVMITGATILTGLFITLLGVLKLGGFVRFLPFPVMGGFLAGTGWLLATGGIGVITNTSIGLDWFLPNMLAHWLPALALGVIMFLGVKRVQGPLVLPGLFIVGGLLFYVSAWIMQIPLTQLAQDGWLLGPFPSGSLWHLALSSESLGQASWPVIINQTPSLVPLALISAIALLLNVSGLELVVQQDIDPNRELVAAGLGNVAAGFLGGLVGYHAISLSTLNHNLSGRKRLPGLITALLVALTVLAGASFLNYMPKMMLGALLVYVGLSLLVEWVYHAWYKFPRSDFMIILLILGIIAIRGFLEAIAAGLVVTTIIFVVNYGRINIVKHELSGVSYHSRVTRGRREQQILQARGEQIYILKLQGFIFFGTANKLLMQIRERLHETTLLPPRLIVLDLAQVTGIDSTGLLSFVRMLQLIQEQGTVLVVTGASDAICREFQKEGLHEESKHLRFLPDLDHGMEWCENEIIAAEAAEPEAAQGLQEQLQSYLPPNMQVDNLTRYLERREIAPGEYLIRQGDDPDLIFFIEEGEITAQLESADGEQIRLESMRGGRSVGEIGFYLGVKRTASVIADKPSVVYCLSRNDLERIEETDPATASLLHRIVVHLLGERVAHLTQIVDALES